VKVRITNGIHRMFEVCFLMVFLLGVDGISCC
jgi:hypothetical protein